jgi:LPXTG-motif cell wall-anchored protein
VRRFEIDTHNLEAVAGMVQGRYDKFMEQYGLGMREKAIIICLCAFGVMAVSYGLIQENNAIFIIGLLFIIGGYLLIRRRLKESIKRRS